MVSAGHSASLMARTLLPGATHPSAITRIVLGQTGVGQVLASDFGSSLRTRSLPRGGGAVHRYPTE